MEKNCEKIRDFCVRFGGKIENGIEVSTNSRLLLVPQRRGPTMLVAHKQHEKVTKEGVKFALNII